MLKNGVRFYGLVQKQMVKTLQQSYPNIKFSNVNSNVSQEQAAPESKTKKSGSANNSAKAATNEPEFYYPVKRINFNKRNLYPIYTIASSATSSLPTAYNLMTAYSWFLAYGVSYIFFLDIYNYWHLLPLTLFFMRGSKSAFSSVQMSGTMVKSIFLKKDGRTLVVTVPKSPVYYKYQEDIDLSAFGNFDNDIKMTVEIDKILRIGFLETLRATEKASDKNLDSFTQSNLNKQKLVKNRKKKKLRRKKAKF